MEKYNKKILDMKIEEDNKIREIEEKNIESTLREIMERNC